MKSILISASLFVLVVATTLQAAPSDLCYEIFIADLVDEDLESLSESEYFKWVMLELDQEYVLTKGTPSGAPILSNSDIVEYCWSEQKLILSDEAATRWNERWGLRKTPMNGVPLLIYVKGVPRYGAILWNPVVSAVPTLPQFLGFVAGNSLYLNQGLSYGEHQEQDVRYDGPTKTAMADLGKLVEKCSGQD